VFRWSFLCVFRMLVGGLVGVTIDSTIRVGDPFYDLGGGDDPFYVPGGFGKWIG
jgi:hypothetical protein